MDKRYVDGKILEARALLDERASAWRRGLRALALPLALALPVGAACAENEHGPQACEDDVDNDGDGLVDCEDEDCAGEPPCAVDLYGAPF